MIDGIVFWCMHRSVTVPTDATVPPSGTIPEISLPIT